MEQRRRATRLFVVGLIAIIVVLIVGNGPRFVDLAYRDEVRTLLTRQHSDDSWSVTSEFLVDDAEPVRHSVVGGQVKSVVREVPAVAREADEDFAASATGGLDLDPLGSAPGELHTSQPASRIMTVFEGR